MRYLILIPIFMFLFYSCRKEKPQNELNKFKFEYVIVNNGDAKASRMTLYASTSYPIEYETWVMSTGKNIFSDDNKIYLKYYDSIVYTPDLKVYKGCTYYLDVRISHLDPLSRTENVKKYTILDTIKSDNQTKLRIVWPNDSALFIKE